MTLIRRLRRGAGCLNAFSSVFVEFIRIESRELRLSIGTASGFTNSSRFSITVSFCVSTVDVSIETISSSFAGVDGGAIKQFSELF